MASLWDVMASSSTSSLYLLVLFPSDFCLAFYYPLCHCPWWTSFADCTSGSILISGFGPTQIATAWIVACLLTKGCAQLILCQWKASSLAVVHTSAIESVMNALEPSSTHPPVAGLFTSNGWTWQLLAAFLPSLLLPWSLTL